MYLAKASHIIIPNFKGSKKANSYYVIREREPEIFDEQH